MKVLCAFSILCLIFLSGCYDDSKEFIYPTLTNTCNDTINVTYSGTIAPILNNYCVSCHNGSNSGGNVNLSSYAGVKAVADNGNLLNSISHQGSIPPMPQGGGQLDNCSIDAFAKWIKAGAPDN
jgi:hypothetical protein